MREVYDKESGAILFKSEDESNPTDKRIKNLENKVFKLTSEVNRLSKELQEIKDLLIYRTK